MPRAKRPYFGMTCFMYRVVLLFCIVVFICFIGLLVSTLARLNQHACTRHARAVEAAAGAHYYSTTIME